MNNDYRAVSEDEIPEEHKLILDIRLDAYESGETKTISLDEVKRRFGYE